MQVDPIKPTLKAPGTMRLKLNCNKLLSCFAFDYNLRRHREAEAEEASGAEGGASPGPFWSHSFVSGLSTVSILVIGRAVLVVSINTRVEIAYGFSA